jgi:hypothetical protein
MTKFLVELDYEAVDKIIVDELRNTRQSLKADLGANSNVFVWGDQESDDIEIQKHIDAIELLLKWYADPAQLVEMGLA